MCFQSMCMHIALADRIPHLSMCQGSCFSVAAVSSTVMVGKAWTADTSLAACTGSAQQSLHSGDDIVDEDCLLESCNCLLLCVIMQGRRCHDAGLANQKAACAVEQPEIANMAEMAAVRKGQQTHSSLGLLSRG